MRTGLIAVAATALLCTIGSASAQSATNSTTGTGVNGTLCSDLLALDTTAQGAFLQGYQAAMQDQLVTAGAGVGANATAGAGTGGDMNSSSVSVLGGGAGTTSAGGVATFNTASIISNCTSSPTSPLSQILSSSGSAAGAASAAK